MEWAVTAGEEHSCAWKDGVAREAGPRFVRCGCDLFERSCPLHPLYRPSSSGGVGLEKSSAMVRLHVRTKIISQTVRAWRQTRSHRAARNQTRWLTEVGRLHKPTGKVRENSPSIY